MLQWISYSSLIPPNLFILLAMIGVTLAWRRRGAGLALATAAMACLYLSSMPIVGVALLRSVEKLAGAIPMLPISAPPGAIIVLSGDFRPASSADGKDIVGPITLQRLAAAVSEARRRNLPILVSGGRLEQADDSLAGMMADSLETQFKMSAKWREERSLTTYQNALYSAEILRRAGVASAFVVTNPWHMARALLSFYSVGYPVKALPIPEGHRLDSSPSIFLPQVPALLDSYYALHELIGLIWYEFRYRR